MFLAPCKGLSQTNAKCWVSGSALNIHLSHCQTPTFYVCYVPINAKSINIHHKNCQILLWHLMSKCHLHILMCGTIYCKIPTAHMDSLETSGASFEEKLITQKRCLSVAAGYHYQWLVVQFTAYLTLTRQNLSLWWTVASSQTNCSIHEADPDAIM